MTEAAYGVSFVLPVKNGARWLEEAIQAILAVDDGRPFELIVVEDGSTDGSRELVVSLAASDPRIIVLDGPGRGAAAALNRGLERACHPLVAQVDQDVVVHPGWLSRLAAALDEVGVGGAQGRYRAERGGPLLVRLAGYELELRYAAMGGPDTDHICTGNSIYRRAALAELGGFDTDLGYGYDNDMSYRLLSAGHRLRFVPEATSTHHWRRGLASYLRQQYGLGYGRLELISKHPGRVTGDRVSGLRMILHVPGMLAALLAAVGAALLALGGGPWPVAAAAAALLLSLLVGDRLLVAAAAARRFQDLQALALVPLHLLRDLIWVWATLRWTARRLLRRPPAPGHSMASR